VLQKIAESLRELNIGSAISAGRDILGEFYEEFLKYANDAKEHGIVFTPRHITRFAAEAADVQQNDIVFDPACGTGGFLVAALDKIIDAGGDVDSFKTDNLYGIEQDASIAALAIVNMIFRGDGSSNIVEADGLAHPLGGVKPTKVLMNPPFSMPEDFEHKFVDRALADMKEGGLLFSVLPKSLLNSQTSNRGGAVWRANLLKKHTLKAVVHFPPKLFYPHVKAGTYGAVIKAHRPHQPGDKVVWAMLDDDIVRSKLAKPQTSKTGNLQEVCDAVRNFVTLARTPQLADKKIDCQPLDISAIAEEKIEVGKDVTETAEFTSRVVSFAPEYYIGRNRTSSAVNLRQTLQSVSDGNHKRARHENLKAEDSPLASTKAVLLTDILETYEKGRSGRNKNLPLGDMPLISCSETENAVSTFVDEGKCDKVYAQGTVTISSNGGCCYAAYHDYEFAANSDVWAVTLKPPYNQKPLAVFVCTAINAEKWRFDYARKFSKTGLEALRIHLPTDSQGNIDFSHMCDIYHKAAL